MNNRLRILDTDILSYWQRGTQPIERYIQSIPDNLLATTVITVEEQLSGRLKKMKECYDELCRRLRKTAKVGDLINDLFNAYVYLHETLKFWCELKLKILPFNKDAAAKFVNLKSQIKIKTKDLQIATIALSVDGVVVTHNRRDFSKVPGLDTEDWTREVPGLRKT